MNEVNRYQQIVRGLAMGAFFNGFTRFGVGRLAEVVPGIRRGG